MTEFPAHPAWDAVLRIYGAPDVAKACLALQERHGINVTLMLFCLWRGMASETTLGVHLPAIASAARHWHDTVVLPLRAVRRQLKPANPQQPASSLYKTLLAAEVDCEHAELLMLAERADALCGPPQGGPSPTAIAANLLAFFEVSDMRITAQDRPALATLLAAAGAGEVARRTLP